MTDQTLLYRSIRRPARAPIPYGAFVRHDEEGCDRATFATSTGICKRGGAGDHQWEVGEQVLIATDGQIRAELEEPIEIMVGGVMKRFQARQPVMLALAGGRVVDGW